MSTLHEKLLAAIAPLHHPRESPPLRRILEARDRALRAVVELHAPVDIRTIGDMGRAVGVEPWCHRCRTASPCNEVKIIARELGVEIGETP